MQHKELNTKPHSNEYLIYCRKSTDDLDNQKNSINYQKIEGIKFAKRENLRIANVDIQGFCTSGIITERHSAYSQSKEIVFNDEGLLLIQIDRPKFDKLVQALTRGEFKGVIFLCWDRASRNNMDNSILTKLINKGLDLKFVQATYDNTSSGNLSRNMDGVFAEQHSKITSEKVTNTNRKMRDEGICTYKAPMGYLNTGDPRHKPFDPIRAPLIRQLFEKYAEGTWSLADLARWANDNGLTTRPVRRKRTVDELLQDEEVKIDPVSRPITFNHTHKILTNPFYIGKVLGNDRLYVKSSSHEALVDEELFYKVQGLLNKKKVSTHYKNKLYFAYRGLIRCNDCKRVYSPYKQKGIDYYGARCVEGCLNKNRNINADFIEKEIGKVMSDLSFTKEEREDIDRQVRNEVTTMESDRIAKIKVIEQQKKKLREDLSYLRNNKLSLLKNGVYTGEAYLSEENDIAKKLETLRNEEEASDVSMEEVVKDVVFLSELLEDAYLYYLLANPTEKQLIITKVFSELNLSGNTLNYKCRNGFKVFENRKSLMCDPTGNRTPISCVKGGRPNR